VRVRPQIHFGIGSTRSLGPSNFGHFGQIFWRILLSYSR